MDLVVKAFAKAEEKERLWREVLECALSSPSPAAKAQVSSVLKATVDLYKALSLLEAAEVATLWQKEHLGEKTT